MTLDNLYGKVPESVHKGLESAIEGLPEKEESKSVQFSGKRIMSAVLVVVMCLGIVVTVGACGNEVTSVISGLFRGLIDDNSGIIDATAEAEGIRLTAIKVAKDRVEGRDEDFYYLFATLHSDTPIEGGCLYAENIAVEKLNEKGKYEPCMGALGGAYDPVVDLLAGTSFARIEENCTDCELVIEFRQFYGEIESGSYRFVIKNLYGIRKIMDEDGITILDAETITYAQELIAEFEVNSEDIIDLPRTVLESDKMFELDGYKFKLESIVKTPMNVWVTVSEADDRVIEVEDQHFTPIALLRYFDFSEEYGLYSPHTEEEREEFFKFHSRNHLSNRKYSIFAEVSDEAAEVNIKPVVHIYAAYCTEKSIVYRIAMNSPIYDDELKSISLQKWEYEFYPITPENADPVITRVEIWNRDNDI